MGRIFDKYIYVGTGYIHVDEFIYVEACLLDRI